MPEDDQLQPITNNPYLVFLNRPWRREEPSEAGTAEATNDELRLSVEQLVSESEDTPSKQKTVSIVVDEDDRRKSSFMVPAEGGSLLVGGIRVVPKAQAITTIMGLLFLIAGSLLMILAWVPREEALTWVKSVVFGPVLIVLGLGMVCLGTTMWVMGNKLREPGFSLIREMEVPRVPSSLVASRWDNPCQTVS
jgi:hypothetical protein